MWNMDWTSIVLGMMTLLGGCGWLFDRKRHKQEVESLKADNRRKAMDLSVDYVKEFRTYIAEPLQREVKELRSEVAELRDAILRISECPHRDVCPVRDSLVRNKQEG